MSSTSSSFSVNLSYQGRTILLDHLTAATTGEEFHAWTFQALALSPADYDLKLLLKGTRIACDASPVFTATKATTKAPVKVLVLASAKTSVEELNAKKQDPLMRGFDQEKKQSNNNTNNSYYWGNEISTPHRDYKFGRLQECSFHDFGHRPTDTTPHAFAARQLLQRLAGDPGVIAILHERHLVVNTLGEMDPIDDRLMVKKEKQAGACLLGYNTNHGLRIDLKLRTDDLSQFRPYFDLVSTLVHELSHNWVGDHNALFWANFGQMRVEYFMAHKRLQYLRHGGKSSAVLAEVPPAILQGDKIFDFVMHELQQEMAQHQLDARMIADPIRQRYHELESSLGLRLGGGDHGGGDATTARSNSNNDGDKRNLALEAAERRAREHKEKEKDDN